MAVMKLMVVAVLCVVWCAAEEMQIRRSLTSGFYPVLTTEGVVRREYCDWNGQKMFLGSRWTSIDCEKCECTTWKKACERKSESEDVPDGCMRIFDEDCDELIVRRDDLWHVCY